ncbi:transient receptor potential-gamma protein-like, partial [Saccoglossus kowalevskii]
MDKKQASTLALQKLFLSAAKRGEKKAILVALDHTDIFDVNCVDTSGKSALVLAVENSNIGRMGRDEAVTCQEALHCRSLNTDFHPDITPVVLAAHNNNFEILQILTENGARIEDPEYYKFFTEEFTLEHSVGTISVYKALTSEAYISLTCDDPIERSFHLSQQMRTLSIRDFEFRSQYEEMADRCECFAADLLSYIRNTSEQMTVMTHDPKEWSRGQFNGNFEEPYKVRSAITWGQKRFVAHSHCQQQLVEHWYKGLPGWRKYKSATRICYSILMMACFPFLSIAYILSEKSNLGRLLTIPYVRFLCYVTSNLFFLVLVAVHYVDINAFDDHNKELDSIDEPARVGRKLSPTGLEYVIFLMVVAMTWQEVSPLFDKGISCCKRNVSIETSMFDICTLTLYWAWISVRAISAMQVIYSIHANTTPSPPLINGTQNITFTEAPKEIIPSEMLFINSSLASELYDSQYDIFDDIAYKLDDIVLKQDALQVEFVSMLDERFSKIEEYFDAEDFESEEEVAEPGTRVRRAARIPARLRPRARSSSGGSNTTLSNLPATHPLLIAEGLLSLAKVFSFLRIVRVTVVHLDIGPMQISFGRMGGDILKFAALFSLILLAFSVGLSELYHLYTEDYAGACIRSDITRCKIPYKNLQTALASLFWALFGMVDLRSLEVTIPNHWLTELVGYLLFAVYNVIAIIALLNILIAMMSNTYTRIEEDADIQWKFSRSTLWISFYEKNASLFPPFNLIPRWDAVKSFRRSMCSDAEIQKKMMVLMHELIQRYFFAQKTQSAMEGGTGGEGAGSWVLQIKQEVSGLKFDTFEVLGYMNKTMQSIQHDVHGDVVKEEEEKGKETAEAFVIGSQFLQAIKDAIHVAVEARLP